MRFLRCKPVFFKAVAGVLIIFEHVTVRKSEDLGVLHHALFVFVSIMAGLYRLMNGFGVYVGKGGAVIHHQGGIEDE